MVCFILKTQDVLIYDENKPVDRILSCRAWFPVYLINNKEIRHIDIKEGNQEKLYIYFSRSFSKYYFIFNAISYHKISKLVCSFNEGSNTPKNNASRFFFRCSFIGALHKILHSNSCLAWSFICLAGSDLWKGLSCSLQRVIQFLFVSLK